MKKSKDSSHSAENNVQNISNYVKLIAGYVATQQVDKLVHTDDRKAIWYLCSGKLKREQIAQESGVSLRTVTTFIDMAKTLGLLEEEKDKGGHARRVVDYCPPEWKQYVRKKEYEKTSESTTTAQEGN